MNRIAVGADHAGYQLKEELVTMLRAAGHGVVDLGTHDGVTPVDYPSFGAAVGRAVVAGEADVGVCVCGTGIGIAIAANKVAGVRAAVVHDVTSARLARRHNDANVVCFGARLIGAECAAESLESFLATDFEGGRHARRVKEIAALEASAETADRA